ncbi:hypothetical protein IV41_GL001190 [Limosilactobacillus ingluviei]|uniref:Uncharacterized protein n=1 Tax=Limosilactobacillus ingluviei TaxID=148604 RepID=A0A0R2H1G4_9LACO|nr:hypothetical protein IV41_GL001190 [Limosilactobacillus ingluviei]MDO4604048.1 hypothetical protein [Limosilactobacillus ingluviei]
MAKKILCTNHKDWSSRNEPAVVGAKKFLSQIFSQANAGPAKKKSLGVSADLKAGQ